MTSNYQTLKEQAQIYENMTGKKCSIYHNNEEQDQKRLKFPSAIHRRRVMTVGDSQNKQYRYNMHSCLKQKQKKLMTRNKHPNDLYSVILKEGIKMTITQQNTSFTQKNDNYRNKTSQITKKLTHNPQEQPKKLHKYLRNQFSDHQVKLQEKKNEIPQLNTASSPVISNHQITLIPIQPKKQTNETNFLSLNKKLISQSYKKTKHMITQQSTNQALLGQSKKQKMQFEKRNKEQKILQQELIKYHGQTKSFIEEIKQKYHLNFTKVKKYLGKIKRQPSIFESQDHQDDCFTKQALKNDQISEQVNHLNFLLKKNKKKLEEIKQSINNNALNQYMQYQGIDQSQQKLENIQEQDENQESIHKKMSLIYRLRQSLANARYQKEQQETKQQSKSNNLNYRLKQLLIHY